MKFKIGFEKEDKNELYSYFNRIIDKEQWSEGYYTQKFEEEWAEYVGTVYAVAFSNWFGAAMAALEYFDVKGKKVGCPSNTFMATPLSIVKAGGRIEFFDCNKTDLCLDYYKISSDIFLCFVVHIGGHIAFEIKEIVKRCKSNNIILLEDCAHAHGASWNGRRAGTWGDAGIYSFAATKTISTGEGGMLVTDNLALAEFAGMYRNYGKFAHLVEGGNYKMSEFAAAIGCVQIKRLDDIVAWKNMYVDKNYKGTYNMLNFPEGMVSGYYKAITFDKCIGSVGKVYNQPCHRIMKHSIHLPNTEWISKNHWCLPLYYKGNEL